MVREVRVTSLVIGANGFLGSHVTRKLVERGDVVAVLETDKSSVDLLAEKPGTVTEIVVAARSITTSGSVLYKLDE